MEILVECCCSDKTVDIPYDKIIQYKYFIDLLKNICMKRKNDKIIYEIPQINIPCSSDILMQLLDDNTACIFPEEYSQNLGQLLYYNYMFCTNKQFEYSTYGFRSSDYFGLLEFIKDMYPDENVYELLYSGSQFIGSCLKDHSYNVCADNKLRKDIMKDLLVTIDSHIKFMKDNASIERVSILVNAINVMYENGFYELLCEKVNESFNFLSKINYDPTKINDPDYIEKLLTKTNAHGYGNAWIVSNNINIIRQEIYDNIHVKNKMKHIYENNKEATQIIEKIFPNIFCLIKFKDDV